MRWALLALAHIVAATDDVYRYLDYEKMLDYFEQLETTYPGLIKTYDAIKLWPDIAPDMSHFPKCAGNENCVFLLVHITNHTLLKATTPEIYFSGALHGDERIGPNTVAATAGFLLENYATDEKVKHLVDTRSIWFSPMTNAQGYAKNSREEERMDPNRDFPYQQPRCMNTITARVVNELFRRHLFQIMVTFHGGTEVISYEWGSNNHKKAGVSTEAPDNKAIRDIADAIEYASGISNGHHDRGYAKYGTNLDKKVKGKWYYPQGTMTDTVYAVNGGMEDWCYGASWENKVARETGYSEPINTCSPKTYGGYDIEKTKYEDVDIRILNYLVETTDRKNAREVELGKKSEILVNGLKDGHIPRNVRLSLRLIELLIPEIRWDTNTTFHGVGCFHMVPALVYSKNPCSEDVAKDPALEVKHQFERVTCSGLQLWAPIKEEEVVNGVVDVSSYVTADSDAEGGCFAIRAVFDEEWTNQVSPDPKTPPQTHLVKARTLDTYTVSVGDRKIEATKSRLFPLSTVVAKVPADTPRPEHVHPADPESEPKVISKPEDVPSSKPGPKPKVTSKPEHVHPAEPESEPKVTSKPEDVPSSKPEPKPKVTSKPEHVHPVEPEPEPKVTSKPNHVHTAEPKPKPEVASNHEHVHPEPESQPGPPVDSVSKTHLDMELETASDGFINPRPLLRADRVFFLWLMVLATLLACTALQVWRNCTNPGFEALLEAQDAEEFTLDEV